MGEMAALMNFGKAKLPLAVIKYPVGTFGFVGHVPAELAYETTNPEYITLAQQFGPGLIKAKAKREGGVFKTRTWPTKEAAIEEAKALGYEVTT